MPEVITEEEQQKIYDIIAECMYKGEITPKNIIKKCIEKYCQLDEKALDTVIFSVSALYAMKIHEWSPVALDFMHMVTSEIKKRLKAKKSIEVV